jgi:hypothetical protein
VTSEELDVLARVNRVRAVQDLRPLGFQPVLWNAARAHSEEQHRHGYMGHGSPDPARNTLSQRMAQAGYDGRVYAEVVAWGYPDTAAVVEGWMNSPEHRRILLDPDLGEAGFSRVGAYWTGNFGGAARVRSAALLRSPVADRDASSLRPPPAVRVPAARPHAAPLAPPAVWAPARPAQVAPRAPAPAPAPAPQPAPLPLRLNPG